MLGQGYPPSQVRLRHACGMMTEISLGPSVSGHHVGERFRDCTDCPEMVVLNPVGPRQ
jgi:hypothetical protein